jgi:hypothetical protein
MGVFFSQITFRMSRLLYRAMGIPKVSMVKPMKDGLEKEQRGEKSSKGFSDCSADIFNNKTEV